MNHNEHYKRYRADTNRRATAHYNRLKSFMQYELYRTKPRCICLVRACYKRAISIGYQQPPEGEDRFISNIWKGANNA